MFIIQHKKIFLAVSGMFIATSVLAIAVYGVQFGIDFTGGTLIEAHYPSDRPDRTHIEAELSNLELGAYSIRPIDTQGYLVRTRELSEDDRAQVMRALSLQGQTHVDIARVTTVGPVIGVELRNKSFVALAVVLLVTILYVAFAFRTVTPIEDSGETKKATHAKKDTPAIGVSSWKYGIVAIIALFHDIIVPIGLFAALGALFGFEIDILFVMALLAILGYSVNDTLVIFDRIRENITIARERGSDESFSDIVGRSLSQTFARSVNTSLTTLLVLLALEFLGSAATTNFVLVLAVGVVAGSFSSLAFAPPLLILLEQWQKKSHIA